MAEDKAESEITEYFMATFFVLTPVLVVVFLVASGSNLIRWLQFGWLIVGITYFVALLFGLRSYARYNAQFLCCALGIVYGGIIQKWEFYEWYFEEHPVGCISGYLGQFLGCSVVVSFGFWLALLCLIIVKIICKRKMRHAEKTQLSITALDELESGNIDKATWAQAVIAANGDNVRARAEYIKIRSK